MEWQTANDSSSGPCLRFQGTSVSTPGPQHNGMGPVEPGSGELPIDMFVCLIWAPDAYVALVIAAVASATNLGTKHGPEKDDAKTAL